MTDMKKLFRALTPLMLAATAAGCGGGDTGGEGGGAGGGASAPAAPAFDMATAGHVTGMVMFEGTAPANEPIDMASESACAAKHSTPPTREDFKVSADGHLADVFVYIKSGLESMTFPVPSEPVVIDQNGCQYVPHVSGVMAGQTLQWRNSDGVLHNVSGSPSINRPFNFGMPGAVPTMDRQPLTSPEVMIPVECDVHGWMYSFIGVTAHPYHAVSNAGGTFDLRNLPPGQYVIEAWHSRLGTQEQTITVATGQTAQVTFTFNQSMIANAVVPLGEPIDPHDHGPVALGEGGAAHTHGTVAAGS